LTTATGDSCCPPFGIYCGPCQICEPGATYRGAPSWQQRRHPMRRCLPPPRSDEADRRSCQSPCSTSPLALSGNGDRAAGRRPSEVRRRVGFRGKPK
jgi:hypothetical protein